MECPVDYYRVKTVEFGNDNITIILQNINGPCPLLAISNILLLQKKISIHPDYSMISKTDLLTLVKDHLLKLKNQQQGGMYQSDYDKNVSDAIEVLPKLEVGLDVNVKFTSILDFEYTTETIVFDLLGINLCHGWIVDPSDKEIYETVKNLSYNSITEKIIEMQCALTAEEQTPELKQIISQGELAQTFIDQSPGQLTFTGLQKLHSDLKDNELAVFFRNYHFSTIYKKNSQLYQLVTDLGYLREPIVWEELNRLDGDICYLKGNFEKFSWSETTSQNYSEPNLQNEEEQNQMDSDYLLALELSKQEQENPQNQQQNQQQQTQSNQAQDLLQAIDFASRNSAPHA